MRLLAVTASICASLAALAAPSAAAWSLAGRDGDKIFDALERQLSRADAADSVDVIAAWDAQRNASAPSCAALRVR